MDRAYFDKETGCDPSEMLARITARAPSLQGGILLVTMAAMVFSGETQGNEQLYLPG